MKQEYLGMRLAIESGGSTKVTLPKQVIEEVWEKTCNKHVPVCYILVNGTVQIEEITRLLKSSEYQDQIILAAKRDWMDYALKLKAKQERGLEKRFIEGEISEIFFYQKVEEIRGPFKVINKKFRETLIIRGIKFDSKKNSTSFSEITSNIIEEEKDTNLTLVLNQIRKIKEDIQNLISITEKLNEGFESKRIPRRLFKHLKKKYRMELKSAEWRLKEVQRESRFN